LKMQKDSLVFDIQNNAKFVRLNTSGKGE